MIKKKIQRIANVRDRYKLQRKGLYAKAELTDSFFVLYRNYQRLLEAYLLKKLPLAEFDDLICNSGVLFTPINPEDMDIYQSISGMNLRYLYLRNTLNVEKLSGDDIEMVIHLSDEALSDPDNTLLSFAERTYKNVLSLNEENEDVCYMVCYGTDRDYFWHDSRDLIIGVRYDEYADNGLGENEEWLNNYYAQRSLLGKNMRRLEPECGEILGIKTHFLSYDEVSTGGTMLREEKSCDAIPEEYPFQLQASEEWLDFADLQGEERAKKIRNAIIEQIRSRWDAMGPFRENLAWVESDGKFGFVDDFGKLLIPCEWDFAWDFSDGFAKVACDGRIGLIDKRGSVVVPCRWDEITFLDYGIIRVKCNGKYGFLDRHGREITPCHWENAGAFWEDLVNVKCNGKWGYIDRSGALVIPCQWDEADRFIGEKAEVMNDGKQYTIDKTGAIVT